MTHLSPGFADPTRDSQIAFRAVMGAMAEPGTIHRVDVSFDAPPGVGLAASAILLALLDDSTPLGLVTGVAESAEYFGFHTGAPLAKSLAEASFVLVDKGGRRPRLDDLAMGDAAYPDRSATLLIEVDGLTSGLGRWRLTGPGIADSRLVCVEGVDPAFPADWATNHQAFPRGVDVLFTSGRHVLALPRSTRLEIV